MESNWIGALLLVAVLSIVGYVVSKQEAAGVSAIVFGLLLIPVAGVFRAPLGWPRTAMSVYAGLTALLGVISVFAVSLNPNFKDDPRGLFLVAFILLALLSGWVANDLATRRVKR